MPVLSMRTREWCQSSFKMSPSLPRLKCPLFSICCWFVLLFLSLTWTGAQPCGVRRAQRLGRSAGPGQRRRPRQPGLLERLACRCLSRRLFPRVVVGRFVPHVCRHCSSLQLTPLDLPSRFHRRGDLSKPQLSPAVLDGDGSVPSFTHQHFALHRRMLPDRVLQLIKMTVVAHHPIVPHASLALQPEDPIQLHPPRRLPMLVLRLGRLPREPFVVLRQILIPQIHVGCLVAGDLLAPQLLHQPILMRPVLPLHSSFGLRRTGGN